MLIIRKMPKKMSFTPKLKFSLASLFFIVFAITASAQQYLNFVDRLYLQIEDSLNETSGVWHNQIVLSDSIKDGISLEMAPILAFGANRVSGRKMAAVYHLGGIASLQYKWKGLKIQSSILGNYSKPYRSYAVLVDSLQVFAGESSFYKKYNGGRFGYVQPQFLAEYKAKKFFNLSLGYAKNFIGDGYRSAILGDNTNPSWFGKIQTKFWRFHYTNLWLSPSASYVDPTSGVKQHPTRKFIAAHFLTYAVNKKFSISFYEAVVWKSKDTLNNRGFDVNYLNPVVFYRPIEFSTGSSDNSLIALSAHWKTTKASLIYGQFLIDEFLVSAVKQDILKQMGRPTNGEWGWWANKQAAQFGVKLFPQRFLKGLQVLAEYNIVRPFTFTHTSVIQSYTNNGQSLALPQGANCAEYVGLISYRKSNWQIFFKGNILKQGLDSDTLNYGQNVLRTSTTRVQDYQNLLFQGRLLQQLHFASRIDYSPKSFPEISWFAEGYYRKTSLVNAPVQQQLGVIIGVCWKGWMPQLDY